MKARRGVRLNRRQSRPLPLTSQRARNSPLKMTCLSEEVQTPLADIARFSFSLLSIVPNVFACQALKNTSPFAAFQPHFCCDEIIGCAAPLKAYNRGRKRIGIAKKKRSTAGALAHLAQS